MNRLVGDRSEDEGGGRAKPPRAHYNVTAPVCRRFARDRLGRIAELKIEDVRNARVIELATRSFRDLRGIFLALPCDRFARSTTYLAPRTAVSDPSVGTSTGSNNELHTSVSLTSVTGSGER